MGNFWEYEYFKSLKIALRMVYNLFFCSYVCPMYVFLYPKILFHCDTDRSWCFDLLSCFLINRKVWNHCYYVHTQTSICYLSIFLSLSEHNSQNCSFTCSQFMFLMKHTTLNTKKLQKVNLYKIKWNKFPWLM